MGSTDYLKLINESISLHKESLNRVYLQLFKKENKGILVLT